jgi:hypothetical protein
MCNSGLFEALFMTRIRNLGFSNTIAGAACLLVAACGMAAAQDQAPPAAPDQQAQPQAQNPADSGWRKFGGTAQDQTPAPAPAPAQAQVAAKPDPSEPVDRSDSQADQGQAAPAALPQPAPGPRASAPQGAPAAPPANHVPAYGLPAEVTVRQGTYVSIRINQMLNSNRNATGDGFSGTLMQPLVADGIVVAQRGQTVYGRVANAQKSATGKPSILALQLTGLTLADGGQAPVQSQMVSWEGGKTPGGMEAGTVIGTTAIGAGIGGAVGWGTGAAIGGGAGLAVGAIAALVTHNHPTVVYPETAMTFRLDAPLVVSTARAPQAFRYVSPNDYNRPAAPIQTRVGPAAPYGAPYGGYYAPYAAPYPYAYYPYPYWGPYFGVGFGWGRFGRRW